jgi:hypothetical protein
MLAVPAAFVTTGGVLLAFAEVVATELTPEVAPNVTTCPPKEVKVHDCAA